MKYNSDLLQPAHWKTDPFPHAVIDGLWDYEDLRRVSLEFPLPSDPRWQTYADPEEVGKKAIDNPSHWGPQTLSLFEVTGKQMFINDLSHLTGIKGLTGDTIGGGLHETGRGGKLGMHVDFNYHPLSNWVRRLNMLVFLNRDWACEWGGCLYLGEQREVQVTPLLNRTVIFECSNESWHGHPHPIEGEHLRRSIAMYYYTEPGSVDLGEAHTTIYRRD